LTNSFNLLIPKSFEEQCIQAIKQYPTSKKQKIIKQIDTALAKIRSDPCSGKMMREIANPRLRGAIRRIYVGGNEGHRLIYIYLPKKPYIIPVFLSLEIRANLNYNKVSWKEIANDIYEDFTNKRYDNFINCNKF